MLQLPMTLPDSEKIISLVLRWCLVVCDFKFYLHKPEGAYCTSNPLFLASTQYLSSPHPPVPTPLPFPTLVSYRMHSLVPSSLVNDGKWPHYNSQGWASCPGTYSCCCSLSAESRSLPYALPKHNAHTKSPRSGFSC